MHYLFMSNIVTVGIPQELIDKAKSLQINVSKLARKALKEEIERMTKTGEKP